MIDEKLCSVHLHLYYEDMSIHILKRLSKVWRGNIYLSMIKSSCSNKTILSYAESLFPEVKWVEVDNKGTDQYGFFHTNKINNEKYKPWILYIHDKSSNKKKWLNDLIDVFLEDEYQTLIDSHINSKKTGIIGAKSCKNKLLDSEELINEYKYLSFKYRGDFVRSVSTLAWLRELQSIFYNRTGIVKEELLNPYFVGGTVFMIRKFIVDQSHSCVHPNFFEDGYSLDGKVEHAMERFYHYVSESLGYNNVFI